MSTEIAEAWAKADHDVDYAGDIVQKASKQLEQVITTKKIVTAKLHALVSKDDPLKLIPISEGRFVLVEWGSYEPKSRVLKPETIPVPSVEEIWEHT